MQVKKLTGTYFIDFPEDGTKLALPSAIYPPLKALDFGPNYVFMKLLCCWGLPQFWLSSFHGPLLRL